MTPEHAITANRLYEIELQARAMRAEAINKGFSAGWTWLVQLPHTVATAFRRAAHI